MQRLTVDLYRAEARHPETFINESLAPIVRPGRPVPAARVQIPDDGPVVLGRSAAGGSGNGSWDPQGVAPPDLGLSRRQLELRRTPDGIRVLVPGEPGSKPPAVVQYWGSGHSREVPVGGAGTSLEADAHACVVLHTATAFYWALLSTPPGPPAPPGTAPGPGHTTLPRSAGTPVFPTGWREAVQVKFRPYLTWPLGWRPAPVEPAGYVDPATGAASDDPRLRSSVRYRLMNLKEAAMAAGYDARTPNGHEIELVEWLVARGMLNLAEHRCPWYDDGG